MSTALFIGSIATTLLNFLPPEDTRGLISAALFTLAALLAIAYSGGIYVYRTLKIRQRSADGLYYDKYGPTVLCFVLFAALATNNSHVEYSTNWAGAVLSKTTVSGISHLCCLFTLNVV